MRSRSPFRSLLLAATAVAIAACSSGAGSSAAAPLVTEPWARAAAGGQSAAKSMPWVFVVDGEGIVRAKYQGVTGSADVDVILALIAQGG